MSGVFAQWSPQTAYGPGDVVDYIGKQYVATVPNIGKPPLQNPSLWTLLSTSGAGGDVAALQQQVQSLTTTVNQLHTYCSAVSQALYLPPVIGETSEVVYPPAK